MIEGLLHLWAGDAQAAVEWFELGVQRMTDQTMFTGWSRRRSSGSRRHRQDF